ncbi:E3 ubiquitin-protein ligase TRIM39-like isoform X2 [Ambystoma mexicanum]|uniref:E3 ubiquitin-protein ligase TRIM39-like isoform X2 n=1 Tax=Ambystoma mexicanum TaxID=8296 RepID=UPI0037E9991F
MAAANPVSSLQEDATCSICLEYYKNPVTTRCGHSFCRSCISECSQGSASDPPCPQCRQVSPLVELRPNRQLQSITESVKQLSVQSERAQDECMCEEHEEKMKLFCVDHLELVCVICRESRVHNLHTVLPIKEAALEYKGKLQTEKKKMMAESERLQQFLKVEDEILFMKVRSGKKSTIAENSHFARRSGQIFSLSWLTTELTKKCEQPAAVFLKDVGSLLRRCENVTLWMEGGLTKYKVAVTLDPDTAHEWLTLSGDRRRVTDAGVEQRKPDHPKRFTENRSVLGKEGFSSGKSYWEVQLLQEDGEWVVGVARESVSRKELITESPGDGVWGIELGFDGELVALTSPPTPLPPPEQLDPLKLGVYLDYEEGELSLYNADSMDHLYTFANCTFSETVYPYFMIGCETDLCLL